MWIRDFKYATEFYPQFGRKKSTKPEWILGHERGTTMKIDLVFALEIPSGAPKLPLPPKGSIPEQKYSINYPPFVTLLFVTKRRHVSLINNRYVQQQKNIKVGKIKYYFTKERLDYIASL